MSFSPKLWQLQWRALPLSAETNSNQNLSLTDLIRLNWSRNDLIRLSSNVLIRLNLGFDDSIRLRLAWKYQLDYELEPLKLQKQIFSGAGLRQMKNSLKRICFRYTSFYNYLLSNFLFLLKKVFRRGNLVHLNSSITVFQSSQLVF